MPPRHDFKRFPELTNGQMADFYFDSPHKQMTEDFAAKVIKVTDGDSIRVLSPLRDFDFPVRIINIAAPEKKEPGGKESKNWLEKQLLNKTVEIGLNPELRVGKWGRLLGYVTLTGTDMGEMSMLNGHSVSWGQRGESSIPDFDKQLEMINGS